MTMGHNLSPDFGEHCTNQSGPRSCFRSIMIQTNERDVNVYSVFPNGPDLPGPGFD
jgi:hypothetical protein